MSPAVDLELLVGTVLVSARASQALGQCQVKLKPALQPVNVKVSVDKVTLVEEVQPELVKTVSTATGECQRKYNTTCTQRGK